VVRHQLVPGFTAAARQPSTILLLEVRSHLIKRLDAFHDLPAVRACLAPLPVDRLGTRFLPPAEGTGLPQRARHMVEQFAHLLASIQESAGLAVAASPLVTAVVPGARKSIWTIRLVCPTPHPAVIARMAPELARILGAWLGGKAPEPLAGAVERLIAQLARLAPPGQNTRLLLDAAFRLEVPSLPLHGRTVQFGWGSRARLMDSAMTDATPTIATRLARDKRVTSGVLAAHGIPVPRQMNAPTMEAALAAAKALGFPLVVKPADLDGGIAVTTGIEDEAALERAYELARRHSPRIVVEAHVPGQDVRLGVVNGRLAWATVREPASIVGDGASSVQQLIDHANRDVRRARRSWSFMTPLSINAEAEALLAAQGLALEDVPEPGRIVRLRSAANISSGGEPRNVLARVHPDNEALALRVARLMRLDLAGIDLIIPDISRSWRETGGAVCEVNAQPQFSVEALDVPFRAVAGLFEGDGRIPTIVILGREGLVSADAMIEAFRARGLRLGLSLPGHLSVDGDLLRAAGEGSFNAVRTLIADPGVDAVVALVDDESWRSSGAPLERIDLLVCAPDANPRMKAFLTPLQMVGVRTLDENQLRAGADALADEAADLLAWHDGRVLSTERVASAALSASPYCRKAPAMPGSIGLCMIARNEAPVIRESLDSVRGLVDFVLVEDTGSTDGTQDVVRQWLEEHGVAGTVIETPWRDFAWNRTHALASLRSRHDIDYALMLDADDVLVRAPGFDVSQFKASLTADAYDLTVHWGTLRFPRPQLLRNARAFAYRGALHEYVEFPPDAEGRVPASGLHVQGHSRGARSRNPRKYEDDAALLEKVLRTEREPRLRARYLFYLAQSYQDGRHYDKAIDTYLARAEIDFWPEEMYVAAYRAARLKEHLRHPPPAVEAAYRHAVEIVPDRLEAYHGLSRFHRLQGHYAEGFEAGRGGLARGDAGRSGLFIESRIYRFGLLEETALNAALCGRYRECAAHCEAVLAMDDVPERNRARLRQCLEGARQALTRGRAPVANDSAAATLARSVRSREIGVAQ